MRKAVAVWGALVRHGVAGSPETAWVGLPGAKRGLHFHDVNLNDMSAWLFQFQGVG